MADVRPFAGLRYRVEVASDLATVLAPPYDVISPEEHRALLQRSPHNVVRLELPEAVGVAADPYEGAAATLRSWLAQGVLARDVEPAFYLYEQQFEHAGRRLSRRVVFGRLRLEPWEAGIVRPHERTMRAPKEDRLRLLRALRLNTSPVFALYRDPDGGIRGLIDRQAFHPLAGAAMPDGQRHRLSALSDPPACAAIADAFRPRSLYVADGHHRYETALTYREERRQAAGASRWTGEEAENFVLAGLTAAEDRGLLVLPIHRLLSVGPAPGTLERLKEVFDVEDAGAAEAGGPLQGLLSRLQAAGEKGPAFGAVGLEAGRFKILRLRHAEKARAFLPPEPATVWGEIDAAVLRYAVLERGLGLAAADLDDGGALAYTEDAQFALREVLAGRQRLAFLLNPTPVERILAVADAGERMPQKSTYFYPKLPSGLVLNPLD